MEEHDANCDSSSASNLPNVQEMFMSFRHELDARHDLREKVVKLSRDVTIESKRMIFLLHRFSGSTEEKQAVLAEAEEKKGIILKKIKQIVIQLHDEDALEFLRAYSPGLQEFIEASSLLHFLRKQNELAAAEIQRAILSRKEVQDMLAFPNEGAEIRLPVPTDEYLLGLADVTGETMRLCINSSVDALGCDDLSSSLCAKLCEFVRVLHNAFTIFAEQLDVGAGKRKAFAEKMRTMVANLRKCEEVCYTLRIRGQEIPKNMLKSAFLENPEHSV